ncbi:hypothetical protein JX265_007718 [Neoarthrinium moseri]|uniref:U three protein 23 n=1 Tax=Neoarthrinium moseri TaxID=1658444 RepID=A0A9P9WJB7_9PEZI|nr:hypothetical protein JX266_000312 [Neoarthrinium moseri]KAI1866417.1 hypothetical protein JX265_007718 [Neoarthrinium moseri]
MPRAKTAKRYRKLMERYSMTFGFREPYQVLVDSELLADACRFKMDLIKGFEQTLSGKVKPLITQCSMRHLYAKNREPGVADAIELGKTFERRRCGHHPDQYPEPLSTLDCLSSVVDPKGSGINKHRYVVASNDLETRASLRLVKGTPLLYISRSVMIMEPMADESVQHRSADERAKLRAEIKRFSDGKKRKREEDDDAEDNNAGDGSPQKRAAADQPEKKKKTRKGPKGPNPLAVKKASKPKAGEPQNSTSKKAQPAEPVVKDGPKRKRRKNKSQSEAQSGEGAENNVSEGPQAAAGGDDSD